MPSSSLAVVAAGIDSGLTREPPSASTNVTLPAHSGAGATVDVSIERQTRLHGKQMNTVSQA
jgi:hypothetical protein